jgi:hypothetical protein
VEEFEINLPQQSSSDPRIRIPLEMMPNEHQVQHYFEYFFTHIHPYVPVLHRQSFYHQWNTNRDSISPLLLEAIFACAAMALEDRQEGNKWLALASSKPLVNKTLICLTSCRTRRKLQGRSAIEHDPGNLDPFEGPRVIAKKGILLSFLDDRRQPRGHGEGPRYP